MWETIRRTLMFDKEIHALGRKSTLYDSRFASSRSNISMSNIRVFSANTSFTYDLRRHPLIMLIRDQRGLRTSPNSTMRPCCPGPGTPRLNKVKIKRPCSARLRLSTRPPSSPMPCSFSRFHNPQFGECHYEYFCAIGRR